MTLETFLSNEKLMAEYNAWINSSIGILVCGVLQERFTRPILPSDVREPINEHTSSFCLGQNAGAWKMLDALKGIHKFATSKSDHIDEEYVAPIDALTE